jgi:TatD DNase family protein
MRLALLIFRQYKMNTPTWPSELTSNYPLVDIGINLSHKSFSRKLSSVLQRSTNANVTTLVITGTSVAGSQKALALCERKEEHGVTLYCTAGVHPHDASHCNVATIDTLHRLLKNPLVKAVGEAGLDYNRMFTPKDVQLHWFEEQVKLAIKVKKPMFLHEREAHHDFVRILTKYQGQLPLVVVHCFTGTAEEAAAYVKMGFYLGFTGYVAKVERGAEARKILASGVVPLERIMIESDGPFMMPTIARKIRYLNILDLQCNEPCTLPLVVSAIAESLGRTVDEVAEAVSANSFRFFGISFPRV